MKKFDYQFRYTAVSLIALFLFLLSCSSSSSTMPMPSNTGGDGGGNNPPVNEVWIQGFAFTPSTLTVAVNTTVKWTNKHSTTHTVTSDTGLFDSGGINTNGMFSFKFTQAGTFNYHCSIHPQMVAKVIVQ